jgi:hypothetical protein
MFAILACSLTLKGPPESCSSWVGTGLASKYSIRLERLARDEHSSLFEEVKTVHCYQYQGSFILELFRRHLLRRSKLERLSIAAIFGQT